MNGKMWRKGSFTVEAACVLSLVLLVVFGVLYLIFFVHNRAWLTAAAYEAALTGSMEGVRQNGKPYEAADAKSRELGNIGFFGAENLTVQTNAGEQVKVSYDLDTIVAYGGLEWHLRTEGSSRIIQPVKWIRKMKAAADVIKGIGDG